MQSKPVDLRTSAQKSHALGGLAASPAQFARGSTKSLGRWRPAILAALEEIQRRFGSSGTSTHLNPSGVSLDALLRQSGLSSLADRAASKPLTAPIAISSTAPQKMKLSTQTMFFPAQLSIARDKSNVQAIAESPSCICAESIANCRCKSATAGDASEARRPLARSVVPPVGNTGGTHIRSVTRG